MNSEPSTRKRKQNTLDESDTPSKKQCNQPAAPDDTSPRAAPASSLSDAVPFSLECPVRKVVKKGKQQAIKGDVFGPKEEDGGFPNLKISYAIRPGNSWTDLRTYRNFSIQEQKFTTGSLVYINKHAPPPEPPEVDASEAELLAFDKENLWVGKILEVKAANTSEVLLRVFWMYWPEELPRGRQKYHGNQELIMSNHMEIVDAKTVTSRADINHWDEKVEDQDVGQRFWRQFYDVQLKETKSGGLSTIRSHCVCGEYYNPDRTMVKCPSPKCGIWNHQECLEEMTLAQTYARLVSDHNPVKSNKKRSSASKMVQLKSALLKTPREHPAPWTGVLKAEIFVSEKSGGETLVTITDRRAQNPEVWTEAISCLRCGTTID